MKRWMRWMLNHLWKTTYYKYTLIFDFTAKVGFWTLSILLPDIEERWKCFYSVIKTTFPFLSTFCINSPSQKSVLIHSHGDDYGSVETLRDIFFLGKPYVDLHQVSSMISHLKHNNNSSISQLLQLMLSHYVRVYPRSRVLQLLDDDGIVNVKIIASCDEEKLAIYRESPGSHEEATEGRSGPWMFPDKNKIDRGWISWMRPECLSLSSTRRVPQEWYRTSGLLTTHPLWRRSMVTTNHR